MEISIIYADVLDWCEGYTGPKAHAILCDPSYAMSKKKRLDMDAPVDVDIGTVGDVVAAYHSLQQWGDTGFMGRRWDSSVAFNPETWRALAKHLHPGGFGMAFASARGLHRMMCAIEDAGMVLHPCVFLWAQGCLSEDTEILTTEGWKTYRDNLTEHRVMCYNVIDSTFAFMPVQEVFEYEISDTAFRIQSDSTDQIVTGNHRCLVERGGKLIFKQAATLKRQEKIPILESLSELWESFQCNELRRILQKESLLSEMCYRNFSQETEGQETRTSEGYEWVYSGWIQTTPRKGDTLSSLWRKILSPSPNGETGKRTDMFKEMCGQAQITEYVKAGTEQEGERVGQTGSSELDRGKPVQLFTENERPQQSRVEGWSDILSQERELWATQNQICALSGRICKHGTQRRLRNGTSAACGPSHGTILETLGSRSSQRSQPRKQRFEQPDAICQQQPTQEVRSDRKPTTTLATVIPIYYDGIVWCVRVPTGAFVARRNGKIFITGNSGFPKATRIDTQIDKAAGKLEERKVKGRSPYASRRPNPMQGKVYGYNEGQYDLSAGLDIKEPATDLARAWQGHRYGLQSLKPAVEPIIVFQKPYENIGDKQIREATGWDHWQTPRKLKNTPKQRLKMWKKSGTRMPPAYVEYEPWLIKRKSLCAGIESDTLIVWKDVRQDRNRPTADRVLVRFDVKPYKAWKTDRPMANAIVTGAGALNIEKARVSVRHFDHNQVHAVVSCKHCASPDIQKLHDVSFVLPESSRDFLCSIVSALRYNSNDDRDLLHNNDAQDDTQQDENHLYAHTVLFRLFPNGIWCGLDVKLPPDFQCDCPSCRHLCDELFRDVQEAAQDGAPSLADALERTYSWLSESSHIPPGKCNDHLSNSDDLNLLNSLANLLAGALNSVSIPYSKRPVKWGRPARKSENHELNRSVYVGGAAHQGGSKAIGMTTQGRWPPNFALCHVPSHWRCASCQTVHPIQPVIEVCPDCGGELEWVEGCRRVGVKRVKGRPPDNMKKAPAQRSTLEDWRFDNHKRTGYADPSGKETVADFQCLPECPARRLGEQSGERQGDSPNRQQRQQGNGQSIFRVSSNGYRSGGYTDKGTAARFFPQADWQHEEMECCESCPVARLDEQAGPSTARPVKPENIGKSGNGDNKGLFNIGSTVQSGYYDDEANVSRFYVNADWEHEEMECSPDCPVAKLDEQAGERGQLVKPGYGANRKSSLVLYSNGQRKGVDTKDYNDSGGASRFYPNADWTHEVAEQLAQADPVRYVPKAAKKERSKGLDDFYWCRDKKSPTGFVRVSEEEWEKLDKKQRARGNIHSTVKPLSLLKWLASLLLPPLEYAPRRILIPFSGTLSEGLGAALAGWEEIVAIEMLRDYVDISKARAAWWQEMLQEFGLLEPSEMLKKKKTGQRRLPDVTDDGGM